MHRYASVCLLVILAAGCGDLTRVPAPPVPLSALDGPQAAPPSDQLTPTSTHDVRLVRAVPPQALLTLHLPDIGGSIERFQETGLYRWLSSPDVKKQLGITWTTLPFAIPGGKNPSQARDNAAALNWTMNDDEAARLDDLSKAFR